MTLTEEKDGERRRKREDQTAASKSSPSTSKKKRAAAPEVGQALRTVYQRAVDEDIPPEMLDLLGKLG